jgi:hypothetical protein
MDILFHGGRRYRYYGVPPGIYLALMAAPSRGKFFHAAVRDVFPYVRLS